MTLRRTRLALLLATTAACACAPTKIHPAYSAPLPTPEMTPVEYPCLTETGKRQCVMLLKSDYLNLENELVARCIALGYAEKVCKSRKGD